MYFYPGQNANEIGDFDVIEHEGALHCFYLSLPSHDQIGHLVSEDGLNWKPLPVAIRTGDPDDFDGDQIWTMGVFRKDDTWFMLYTALSEHGLMQRIGLATSGDLIKWKKYSGNPVISADPRWYEVERHGEQRVDWRDPHVVHSGGRLHGFICARRNEGLLNRRGCAGYFVSDDGYNWRVQPPAATPANCFDWECPSVFEHEGRFYMVAIAGGHRRMAYRVAEKIEGPYLRPHDDSLLPGLNLSMRPCFWRGEWHLFHWQRGEADWGAPHVYVMLASPKRAHFSGNETLSLESYDWREQTAGESQMLNKSTQAVVHGGEWNWTGNTLIAQAHNTAGIWLTEQEYEDYILCAELQLDQENPAKEFGLVLRADDDGSCGLFASIIPGRYSVELVYYFHNRLRGNPMWPRGRTVKQSHHFAPPSDGKYSLRAIAFGPNIEFNLNGKLVLATMTLPRRVGRTGLFIEDGCAPFSDITVQQLRASQTKW